MEARLDMRIGVIGVPGGWSSELLADTAAQATGSERLLIDVSKVRLDMDSGQAMFGAVDLAGLDGLIIKKIGAHYSPMMIDRLETLRFLEGRGLPVFSSPERIIKVVDRMSCTVSLRLAGIPMPPTSITEDVDEALHAVGQYGEAVFKPLFSTKARGMFVLKPGPDARDVIAAYASEHGVMYIQKTIELNGKDYGLVFLGGEYMAAYARCKTNGSWNTTTMSGGRYAPVDPPREIIELARKAQEPFGLDFTCVDVALTRDGPYIFEISAFGGFRGLRDACGIDAARAYVDYAIKRIQS